VLRIEFKTFVNAFVRLPCQVVRSGRKLVYRLLGWNPYEPIFFRLLDVLRCCRRPPCCRSPDAPIRRGTKSSPADTRVNYQRP
jgi:hypothetical protein